MYKEKKSLCTLKYFTNDNDNKYIILLKEIIWNNHKNSISLSDLNTPRSDTPSESGNPNFEFEAIQTSFVQQGSGLQEEK